MRVHTFGGSWGAVLLLSAGCGSGGATQKSDAPTGTASASVTASASSSGATSATQCEAARVEVAAKCDEGLRVNALKFAPDAERALVSLGNQQAGQRADVWNLRAGTLERTLATVEDDRGSVAGAWTRDGSRLATVGVVESSTWGIRLYDGRDLHPLVEDPDSASMLPWAFAFSPDNGLLAVNGLLGQVKIFDVATGRVTATVAPTALRSEGPACNPFEWSGEGSVLLAEGPRTRDKATLIKKLEKYDVLAFAPKRDVVAGVAWRGDVSLIDLKTMKVTKTIDALADVTGIDRTPPKPDESKTPPILQLAFSPDGSRFFAVLADGRLRIFDGTTGQMTRELRVGVGVLNESMASEWASAAINADNSVIGLTMGPESFELYDLESGKAIVTPTPTTDPSPFYYDVVPIFSPDGSLTWDPKSGQIIETRTGKARIPLADPPKNWLRDKSGVVDFLVTSNGVARLSDGEQLVFSVVTDKGKSTLLVRTTRGVYSGPREKARCTYYLENPPKNVELSDRLLADFWAGHSVAPRCP
ncbi:MAG: WD40 repeat domain-containing protein [Polyangiaceae bacterium]